MREQQAISYSSDVLVLVLVLVHACVQRAQHGEDPSPYVELRVSDDRAEGRTRVRELTRDPIWDEVLSLVVADPQPAALQISVRRRRRARAVCAVEHTSTVVYCLCAQVFDSRVQKHGAPVALGAFSLPLATLLLQPQMIFANPLPLTNKFGYDSYIYLVIALRVLRSLLSSWPQLLTLSLVLCNLLYIQPRRRHL